VTAYIVRRCLFNGIEITAIRSRQNSSKNESLMKVFNRQNYCRIPTRLRLHPHARYVSRENWSKDDRQKCL